MSMHLLGPWMTTTSYKKRKQKITKTGMMRYQTEHADFNRRMKREGRHQEQLTLEQYIDYTCGKLKLNTSQPKVQAQPAPRTYRRETEEIPSLGIGVGVATKGQDRVYTGTKIKGIGTMHKSNAVPIFSDDEAKEISKMRRG